MRASKSFLRAPRCGQTTGVLEKCLCCAGECRWAGVNPCLGTGGKRSGAFDSRTRALGGGANPDAKQAWSFLISIALQPCGNRASRSRCWVWSRCDKTSPRTSPRSCHCAAKAVEVDKGGNLPCTFAARLRCSLVTDCCGQAPHSRLVGRQNPGGILPPLFISTA